MGIEGDTERGRVWVRSIAGFAGESEWTVEKIMCIADSIRSCVGFQYASALKTFAVPPNVLCLVLQQ